MDQLQKNILKTLIYYDLFDYPLTIEEIQKYLFQTEHGGQEEIKKALAKIETIEEKDDYCFLAGRQEIVAIRQGRAKNAKEKWQILDKHLPKIIHIPFLRGLLASGSLALNNTDKDSDLDIFVIAAKNKIWTCRFFLMLKLKQLNILRHGQDTKNKICPNHFITEDHLTLGPRNIYTARLYSHLVPLLGSSIFFQVQRNNLWISHLIPAYPFGISNNDPIMERKQTASEKLLGYNIGWLLEKIFKFIQLTKIWSNPTHNSPYVIVSDKELAFHPKPQEPKILRQYQEQLEKYGLS